MSRLAVSRDPELDVYEIDIPLSNDPTLPRLCGFSLPTIESNWKKKHRELFCLTKKKSFKIQRKNGNENGHEHNTNINVYTFWTKILGCVSMCQCVYVCASTVDTFNYYRWHHSTLVFFFNN